jgi:class 3 adenylate cyclase/TolB-like protein
MQEDFISNITGIIEQNVDDEQFGVSELAEAVNMSRSNLLRKIKKHTGLSASQFIRQVRLEIGMDLLKEGSFTVSEISWKVGFGSTSYFIKCFREHYGYPPGEVAKGGDVSSGESNSRHRLLAAIMFTDIVGYTSLMQSDESKGIAYRERHREVFNTITKKYRGRILQYYGDGTLSTFPSAIDAVKCGIEMQRAFREEPKVPIRIGIHTGDIIVTEEEIIGDGVNVAARVEAMAEPGTVFISGKVYDEVKNQPELFTTSKGVHKLKNISNPIEVYSVSDQEPGGIDLPENNSESEFFNTKWAVAAVVVILLGVLGYFTGLFSGALETAEGQVDKSIAVLPFKNESSDSSNVYFINGLMESTLNNLQKIEDLRVVSRTSVEKYRNAQVAIPEMAQELNVNYFVEGSGQRVGDKVLLNVQLIDARSDKHIWAEQYSREIADVFELQNEVATKIADAIEAIVTPAELEQIDKIPTNNLVAYDYYLQGLETFHRSTKEGLEVAIPLFRKAVEEDSEFALAYANLAISYYFLEIYQVDKQYTEEINNYADKALLYDPRLAESLIAKAFYYMHTNEFRLAVPHLEKALEYNPNSSAVIQTLSDLYARYVPNTAKYLEYALKGIQIDIAANDSIQRSYLYLHLSNAFIQNGFVDEAIEYINLSLEYNPQNEYSPYLKPMILYARDYDLDRTKRQLVSVFRKDTTRLDILQEVAKVFYFEHDYDSAFYYYSKFVRDRERFGLQIYPNEDAKIGYVYEKMGREEEAKALFRNYAAFCEADQSIYRSINRSLMHAHEGDVEQGMEELKQFAAQSNYQYWVVLFLEDDPLIEPLKNHPDYEVTIQRIKDRFWKNKADLEEDLKDQGLI